MITWRSAAVIAASSSVGEIDFSMGVVSRPRARRGRRRRAGPTPCAARGYADDADEYLAQLLELVRKPVLEHELVQPKAIANGGLNDGSNHHLQPATADIIG